MLERIALVLLAVFLTATTLVTAQQSGRSTGAELTNGPATASRAADEPSPVVTPQPLEAPPPPVPQALGYSLAPILPEANFEWMLDLEVIPGTDGAMAVLTKAGQIWRVGDSSGEAVVLGDLSSRLIPDPHVEEGLLSFAFSPRFPQDGLLYVSYTAGAPRRSVISRFDVSSGAINLASEAVILEVEQPFANHNGGNIAFGPDGYLYIAYGDGGDAFDPLGNGQSLATLLSKMVRIDVSLPEGYAVPPDNPFIGVPGVREEIYASGLRNPWRFSFDASTGALWVGDVGQDSWEEINRIVPGGNYAWSTMEGEDCFRADACDRSGLELPYLTLARESPNQAVIGGFVYRGSAMPELEGWYIYTDWGLGKVWALNITDGSSPIVLLEDGPPVTSMAVLPDGELALLAFPGAVYQLQPVPP